MANLCEVNIDLTFKTTTDADTCFRWLEECVEDAKGTGDYPKFGDSDFEIDVAYLQKAGDVSILLQGQVRWCIDEDSFIKFIRIIVGLYDLTWMRADYQETGQDIQGRWQWDDETRMLQECPYTVCTGTVVEL